MKKYFAVVDKDIDSAFSLWFPDVPGCFSASDSEADILKNGIEALTLHLDGIDAPITRGIDEIAKDTDVAAALETGAYLLSVPYMTTFHKQVRANISMDKGMLDAIDQEAALRNLTRSAFIAEAAKNEIEGRNS